MISNAQIKLVTSLSQKKYRERHKLFIIEGVKIVNEVIFSNYKIHIIFAIKEWVEEFSPLLPHLLIDKVNIIDHLQLKKISQLTTPNKALAIAEIPNEAFRFPFENEIILFLDSLKDPGNLGTIIRIADWYGIKDIICSEDCVDLYNPKVLQASMGSFCRVNVHYCNLIDSIKKLNKHKIYGCSSKGTNIHSVKLIKPSVLIIGNESKGINNNLHEYIHQLIAIPRYGKAESLNAAIAAGIILDKFKIS